LSTVFDFLSLLVFRFSISSGLKEKKATSDADISADPIKSIIINRSPINILKSGVFTPTPESINKHDRG
jgi:hypothetical protein